MKVTKQIEVRLLKKRLIPPVDVVQYDTGVQLVFSVVDFDIPSGTSAMLYVQKRSGKFVYQEDGITVSGNVITVDLENQALTEYGETKYQVRLKNGTDLITTFTGVFRIEKSLADSGAEESKTVVSSFSELTAEKIREINFATGEIVTVAKAMVADKGVEVLATIPADYTETHRMADEAIRTKADAIVCDAEGEAVAVADASDDFLRGLKLFGKSKQITTTGAQLLPITEDSTKIDRGLQQTITDGVCIVSGTATSTAAFNLTLCGSYYETEPIFTLQPGTYTVKDCMIVSYDGTTSKKYVDTTFTLTEAFGVTWVATRSYAPDEVVSETTYPMLNSGDVLLDWERYTGCISSPNPEYPQEINSVENPVVSVCGKNLIPNINSKTSGTVTFTANEDGSFTVNGTADAYRFAESDPIDAVPFRGKTVTLSGKQTFSKNHALQIYCKCDSGNVFNSITGAKAITFTIPNDAVTMSLQCFVTNEKTVENVVIYPQLEFGEEETNFEPYKAHQIVTTSHALPGIPVSSGGNYTDADGQQWICDEVDLARGVYVQRIYSIQASALEWIVEKTTETYYEYKTYSSTVGLENGNLLSTHFRKAEDNRIVVGSNRNVYARFPVSSGIDTVEKANEFFASDEITILARLLEPIETALTAAEIEAFKALHSNYPNTTVLNDAGAWMAVEYNADTKKYIDRRIAELMQ